jgi:hypothetical protein
MPDFCQDCTCGRAQANADNEPTEEVVQERSRPERSFTAPEDWIEPTEGIEPVAPLRSKAWWNNPADGESSYATLLMTRHVWGICGTISQ